MKTLCSFLLIAVGTAAQDNQVSRERTARVAVSLRTMQTIKSGMTRADLVKVFMTEGGTSPIETIEDHSNRGLVY
jgi:hypothetical protein